MMPGEDSKHILIITGEASGDIYGGQLAQHLYKQLPVRISGIGGKRMKEAGVSLLYDSSSISVVGISEVFSRIRAIRQAYKEVKKVLHSGNVDLVILIDYPGFNIQVAGVAAKMGIPVVYYIGPQVWAWRKGRIKTLAKRIKKMIVILPFEEPIYKEAGIDCSFIGHPLVDEIQHVYHPEEIRHKYGLSEKDITIGLFPGSRPGEIKTHLPIILEAAEMLKEKRPDIQFVLAIAESIEPGFVQGIISRWQSTYGMDKNLKISLVHGEANNVLNVSDIVIAVSGTITLQAALFEKPMVIIYKVSSLTYLIARMLVNVKDIGLVNILAGRRIVPELIQHDATPENIIKEVRRMIKDREYYNEIHKGLHEIKLKLGPPGAMERVARVIGEML